MPALSKTAYIASLPVTSATRRFSDTSVLAGELVKARLEDLKRPPTRKEHIMAILAHSRGVQGTGCRRVILGRRCQFRATIVLPHTINGSRVMYKCTNCHYASDKYPCGAVPDDTASSRQDAAEARVLPPLITPRTLEPSPTIITNTCPSCQYTWSVSHEATGFPPPSTPAISSPPARAPPETTVFSHRVATASRGAWFYPPQDTPSDDTASPPPSTPTMHEATALPLAAMLTTPPPRAATTPKATIVSKQAATATAGTVFAPSQATPEDTGFPPPSTSTTREATALPPAATPTTHQSPAATTPKATIVSKQAATATAGAVFAPFQATPEETGLPRSSMSTTREATALPPAATLTTPPPPAATTPKATIVSKQAVTAAAGAVFAPSQATLEDTGFPRPSRPTTRKATALPPAAMPTTPTAMASTPVATTFPPAAMQWAPLPASLATPKATVLPPPSVAFANLGATSMLSPRRAQSCPTQHAGPDENTTIPRQADDDLQTADAPTNKSRKRKATDNGRLGPNGLLRTRNVSTPQAASDGLGERPVDVVAEPPSMQSESHDSDPFLNKIRDVMQALVDIQSEHESRKKK